MDSAWLSMFFVIHQVEKKSFTKWFKRYCFSVPLLLQLWCGLWYSFYLNKPSNCY